MATYLDKYPMLYVGTLGKCLNVLRKSMIGEKFCNGSNKGGRVGYDHGHSVEGLKLGNGAIQGLVLTRWPGKIGRIRLCRGEKEKDRSGGHGWEFWAKGSPIF